MCRRVPLLATLLLVVTTSPFVKAEPEAVSLFGQPLTPSPLDENTARWFTANLHTARQRQEVTPNADNLVWLGRRLAYLGKYRAAIETFSQGIQSYPDDPRFLRHRGHRYITTRQFALAVEDLSRAASLVENQADQIEPDGLPNAAGIPTSTLQSNIYYHLGLAHYLRDDVEGPALAQSEHGAELALHPQQLADPCRARGLAHRRRVAAGDAELLRLDEREQHPFDDVGPSLVPGQDGRPAWCLAYPIREEHMALWLLEAGTNASEVRP